MAGSRIRSRATPPATVSLAARGTPPSRKQGWHATPSPALRSAPRLGAALPLSHRLVAQPADSVHVRAFDADEACRPRPARRVQIALVVKMGVARREGVVTDMAHLAGLLLGRRLDQRPIAHQRLAARLAIDRPGRPVIMRRRFAGAVVDMGEDAESQFRILVDHLALG